MAYSSKSGVTNDQQINPMAQTFALAAQHGEFLTKIEVFFQEKSATYPITLALRNVENGGHPNIYQIIPGSQVTKNASTITVSTNASVATSFEFDEPLYLHPGKMYAFTLWCSEENTYKVWGGKILDFDLGSTTNKITKNLAPGNLFKGNSGMTFSPETDTDLKYNLYIAKFNSTTGTAKFFDANVDEDPLIVDPFTGTASSAVIRVQHPNHGFQINDRVNIIGVTGTVNGITAANLNGRRIITAVDGTGYKFNAGGNATAAVEFGGSGIFASKQVKYDVIQPSLGIFNPRNAGTVSLTGDIATSKSFAGGETAYGVTSTLAMINDQDTKLDLPHVIMNDSNENLHSITQSTIISAAISSDVVGDRVAPFIDAQRANLTVIGNIIDNQDSAATTGFNVPLNFVAETHPTSGTALAKHITKTIRLEEPSTGMRVLYGANVQEGTTLDVYYRTGAIGDDSDLTTTSFTAASVDADPGKSIDENQYKEYEYNIGATAATTLPEFNAFQVKIVMNSTKQNIVPKIRDLSVIALGT
tara:strand:+ start:3885 stop:5477 length:1593 start_codon:yes stop_codon:yes gene_type:complete